MSVNINPYTAALFFIGTIVICGKLGDSAISSSNVCKTLPLRDPAVLITAEEVDWYHKNTINYYGIGGKGANCCVNDNQVICLDGSGIVFGERPTGAEQYSVTARTIHCINARMGDAVDMKETYPDDPINRDALDGYITTGLYIYTEYGLNCSFSGLLPTLSDETLRDYREQRAKNSQGRINNGDGCPTVDVAKLPFKGGLKPEAVGKIEWHHPGTNVYYDLYDPCFSCYATSTQIMCTNGRVLVFGNYSPSDRQVSLQARTAFCIDGNIRNSSGTLPTYWDDPIRDDLENGRLEGNDYMLREYGLNCTVGNHVKRSLALSGSQCPVGVPLRVSKNNRQAISGITMNDMDHIHIHSLHAMVITSCSSGYQAYGAQQFSRHYGHGSGELFATIAYCEDSFSGNQNPLIRLSSSSGFTSARGKLRNADIGKPGCNEVGAVKITAGRTLCNGYSPIAFSPHIVVNIPPPMDQFWNACG